MSDKQYKIQVPKAGAADALGTTVKLYQHGEIVSADSDWLDELMQTFVTNGWAIETKMDEPETELVRARNDDGSFKADDPDTPDVNEAWEEQPKKTTKKRGRPKKEVD